MADTSESDIKEVFIVKRCTKMDSEDYVSIQLKSSEDSIEELLKKAMSASTINSHNQIIRTMGVQ